MLFMSDVEVVVGGEDTSGAVESGQSKEVEKVLRGGEVAVVESAIYLKSMSLSFMLE